EGLMGMPITWGVDNDYTAMKTSAVGEPAVITQPRSLIARSVRAIARQIGGLPPEQTSSPRWRAWLPQFAAMYLP
ncbi:MAG: hypothetical protein LC797_08610, partial [Chloroflexi bacterium]|nr:hypothetical protein [Chloroflexota bacterium]